MDCGAYVTLFARTLYDALDDLTETSLVDCLQNLGSDSELHVRVLKLRACMLKDLRKAARYFGQNKEPLEDFGSGVEHSKYVLQQLGGRMQASNLRGAALHMADVLSHMLGVVDGKAGEEDKAVAAFWHAMSCAAQRPTSTTGGDGGEATGVLQGGQEIERGVPSIKARGWRGKGVRAAVKQEGGSTLTFLTPFYPLVPVFPVLNPSTSCHVGTCMKDPPIVQAEDEVQTLAVEKGRSMSPPVSQVISESYSQSGTQFLLFLCFRHITVERDALPDSEGPKMEGVDVDL